MARKPKKKNTLKGFDPSKYINLTPTMNEAKSKTIVISFGRMNPPTIGHEKLINKIITEAAKRKADSGLYLSHTQDNKKNPLSYEQKAAFATKAFGRIVKRSKARTIIEVAKELSSLYDNLVVVVGSDRISEFERLLNKYNGTEYNFDTIEIVSAGERDPDADGVSGMSASKLRSLAVSADLDSFTKGLPQKLRPVSVEVYNAIRKGMGMTEETLDEVRAPLTLQQRRRRALTMRRYKSKIATARKRAKRRKASPEKLKARAQKKAREIIRKRLSAQKAYKDMSPSEKIALDKRMMRIPSTVIDRIARRQLPQVRKAEIERLSKALSPKKEDINEDFDMFLEDYYVGMAKSTAEKRKAQFKKQSKMSDDNPAAYKQAPGDASAKTKPSVHTKKFKQIYGEACSADTLPRKRYHMALEKNGSVKIDKRFKIYRPKLVENTIDAARELMEEVESLFESADKAVKNKAEQTGIPYSILKKVFDRGVAAWKTGHRPGTTPAQWGLARINSFSTGGKTRTTADADLWAKYKGIKESADSSDREQGTDSLVKIYKKDTPGQKIEAYNSPILSSQYGSFRKGSRVTFVNHSMDTADNDLPKEGTVIGSNTQHLRVRADNGMLYNVRHSDAKNLDSVFESKFAARGFEGAMIEIPEVPVRMIDGKIKKLPAGKSSSSKGNGGD